MKSKLISGVFLICAIYGSTLFVNGQDVLTYYKDIEPIVSARCISCHKIGGIAPFSLTSYSDLSKRAKLIKFVTTSRYMPPWKASIDFQQYKNQNILSDKEIKIISEWIDRGFPEGVTKSTQNKGGSVKGVLPDLSFKMPSSYQLSNQAKEDFRFFVIPSQLKQEVLVSSIEFVPGNKQQVHHSRVMVDTTNRIRGINGMSEYDPLIRKYQAIPLADEFLYGWVPGNNRIVFPPGAAKRIPKGADLILNIHYSPTSKVQSDRSYVNFYLTKEKNTRDVQTLTLRENHIRNQPFYLPANSKPTFYIDYMINRDISLISIMPHMHFVGKSFLAYALTPSGVKIPLVKIEEWDFNWQTTYQFKRMLRLPAFSRIIIEAQYDNTSSNPANPSSPPKGIGYGWNSTDEMLNAVFYYLDYKKGDELLDY